LLALNEGGRNGNAFRSPSSPRQEVYFNTLSVRTSGAFNSFNKAPRETNEKLYVKECEKSLLNKHGPGPTAYQVPSNIPNNKDRYSIP